MIKLTKKDVNFVEQSVHLMCAQLASKHGANAAGALTAANDILLKLRTLCAEPEAPAAKEESVKKPRVRIKNEPSTKEEKK